jgi:hypothetical protein
MQPDNTPQQQFVRKFNVYQELLSQYNTAIMDIDRSNNTKEVKLEQKKLIIKAYVNPLLINGAALLNNPYASSKQKELIKKNTQEAWNLKEVLKIPDNRDPHSTLNMQLTRKVLEQHGIK